MLLNMITSVQWDGNYTLKEQGGNKTHQQTIPLSAWEPCLKLPNGNCSIGDDC